MCVAAAACCVAIEREMTSTPALPQQSFCSSKKKAFKSYSNTVRRTDKLSKCRPQNLRTRRGRAATGSQSQHHHYPKRSTCAWPVHNWLTNNSSSWPLKRPLHRSPSICSCRPAYRGSSLDLRRETGQIRLVERDESCLKPFGCRKRRLAVRGSRHHDG